MNNKGTQHQFGYEWNLYREILPIYKEQFCHWIAPLDLAFFQDKTLLDAGCGIGRNSYWPLLAGAKSCYAFDYDQRTVEVAKQNLQQFKNCTIAFQSIYQINFNASFDVVMCIGVIHHLADPRQAIENLVQAVKPGGILILWVYAYEGNERYLKWVNPVRTAITSRLPLPITRIIAKVLTLLLKAWLLFPQRKPYFQLLKKMSFRHIESIVFDQLLPTIAHYWTKEEVLQMLAGLPLENLQLTHTNKMSWTIIAKKSQQ
ncbi:methyltransferase [Thioploca ingrica]|uniref:Methyltransferase n=1 Tax=Thioploca ingrica TaxID=40754 RepID=A0A090BU52_9GAMM|nr:methyltransferase [Thioploca ingrica]